MSLVEMELEHGVALITLNDPERRNAFFPESIDALVKVIDAAEGDPDCGAIVITGAPPAFCGGASLGSLEVADEQGIRDVYAGFLRVAECRLPTVAAVNGAAVGAGMNLALACDIRLVGASGYFESRFMKLGLHPGGGHTWMLRAIAGPQAAAALLLFQEVARGDEAVRLGLAYRCYPDDELVEAARGLAGQAARGARPLVERTKAVLREMIAVDTHHDAVGVELEPQVWSLQQPFFRQGLGSVRHGINARRDEGRISP